MTVRRGFGAVAVAFAAATAVLSGWSVSGIAQGAGGIALPGWKPADICLPSSARGQCEAFEYRAYRAVSGSWAFIPDAIRSGCLGVVRTPVDQSWRVLGDCIEERMAARVDKGAVMTSATPSEAVPPPKQVQAPAVVVQAAPPVAQAPIAAPTPAPAPAAKVELPPIAPPAPLADRPAVPDAAAVAAAAAKVQAEAKARADAEAAAKVAAEAKAKADADAAARAKADAEAKVRAEAEAAAQAKVAAERAACLQDITAAAKAGQILFATARATLDARSGATLDALAARMKTCPTVAVSVDGHTDSTGNAEANVRLSQERAEAVVAALVQRGVLAARLKATGVGSARPLADNSSAVGRASNRRIEFTVGAGS